jgi:thioester reductase-like protein
MSASVVGELESRLAIAVATTLRVPVELVHSDTPFTLLGMDSLGAVELTSALGDALGAELQLSAVHEYPDVASLARFLEGGAAPRARRSVLERMQDDSVLPSDIAPARGVPPLTRDAREVLLTGATGFVGAHLLRSLLDESPVRVHCLVRGANAAQRVRANLERYGLWADDTADRVRIVNGDLARPMLGLGPAEYDSLAGSIGAIYHGAAAVNWVHGYDGLRDANVLGTREVLRLACHHAATPVHFLSSLGVCYSTRAPGTVDETSDVFAHAAGLHLGYAQSKCVAEELVRSAGARGLPVTITRPALVSGHSVSGVSNTGDLLARFIAGCIVMRAAPDLDWRVDCVPVDHVARAVVALSRGHQTGTSVAHLANARARHWRECVLWMRLCGYELELVPYGEWMRALRASATAAHPLHELRSFFLQGHAGEGHLTLPELYEESRRSHASSAHTDARLAATGLHCPAVDTAMLDRYFDDYVKQGLIAEAPRRRRSGTSASPGVPDVDPVIPLLEEALRRQRRDPTLRISKLSLQPLGGEESIVGELTSWRHATACGLFRGQAEIVTDSGRELLPLFVKAKAADEQVLEVAQCVAALADPVLGAAYARFRDDLGFTRSHHRELALYAHPDERLRRNSPHAFVVERDDESRRWLLVLESVEEATPTAGGSGPWPNPDIEAALQGLAEIHAVWYERLPSPAEEAWLPPTRPAARMEEMKPLWSALARHAREHSPAWRDGALADLHQRLAESMDWAVTLDALPATLIHNDFNPRNIVIREIGGVRRLCAYDWELARIGVPQRDLAELLCFVLPASVPRATVAYWMDRSRRLLQSQTGHSIDAGYWDRGFRASLCDLLVDRLAMYAMVSRFRPQRFLPRVVRTWQTLNHHYPWTAP